MQIQETRLRNLTYILNRDFGGVVARLARAVEKSANHMRVVLNPERPGGRFIGEVLARQLEARLGLPANVLDIEDENLYHSHIGQRLQSESDPRQISPADLKASRLAPRTYPLLSWPQAAALETTLSDISQLNPVSWHVCHKDLGQHGYVLRVEDEAMVAAGSTWSFPAGMLLYVNATATPEIGQFVVVLRAGATLPVFRRLVLVEGERYLEALNHEWPKRYTPLSPDDALCGVVVHAGLQLP